MTITTVHQALRRLFGAITHKLPTETIPTVTALDRVTAVPIAAPTRLPDFPRATVDGFAVQAPSTFGASEALPTYLRVVNEVPLGRAPLFDIDRGEAARIYAGGMMPPGANAVVMLENTQPASDNAVQILRAVSYGENVLPVGAEIEIGDIAFPSGAALRPQDIGALMALGVTQIDVMQFPVVGLLALGEEVIDPTQTPAAGQTREINVYTIAALSRRAGAIPIHYGFVPDDVNTLRAAIRRALYECDLLVISTSSAPSIQHHIAAVLAELDPDGPGILANGLALKPGRPAMLAVIHGKPVIGVPSNPISALTVADLILLPTLFHLQNRITPDPRIARARLTHNITSEAGRGDIVPARLFERDGERWVEPIFDHHDMIFALVRADGAIIIPHHLTLLTAGDWVAVRVF